jgi:transglutaminase-like putative cysteine protease
VLAHSLKVEPEPHFINWQQDPFANYLARLVFPKPARRLTITVDVVAHLTVIIPDRSARPRRHHPAARGPRVPSHLGSAARTFFLT